MSDKTSEADGAMLKDVATRFGSAFGTSIAVARGRERGERSVTRTDAERARGSRVQLKLINFKCDPSEEMMLMETATRLGITKTDVIKRGIHLVAEQAKKGR